MVLVLYLCQLQLALDNISQEHALSCHMAIQNHQNRPHLLLKVVPALKARLRYYGMWGNAVHSAG